MAFFSGLTPTSALAVVDCSAGYEPAVLGLSPVGYWRLGESSGSTAVDETGINDGTYVGPMLGLPGAIFGDSNTAAEFDGVNDSVDVGTFDVSGTGLTIVTWFNADDFDVTDARLVSKTTGTSTSSHTWMLGTWLTSGEYRLRARVNAGGSTTTMIASTGSLSTNRWHLGVLTYDGTNMTLFLDGQQLNSVGKSGSVGQAPTVPTWIGDNSSGIGVRPFDGTIDDVAILDYALSATEVSDLYACGTPPFQGESQWTLDEASGTSAADAVAGNTGTYRNGPVLNQAGACPTTGTSVRFDGSNDHVEIAHINGYLLDDGTVTLWAKADSLGSTQSLFSKDSSGFDTGGHITIYLDPSGAVNVRLQSTTTSYNVTSSSIVAGEWFHVAFSWGVGGMKLTVNASEEVTNPYTGGLGTTSGGTGNYEPIAVGANSWGSGNLTLNPLSDYFDGFIDDVHIFDSALSAADIDAMYCEPVAFPGGSRWLLDETTGTVMTDAQGYNDGVYLNGPLLNQPGQCNTGVRFDGTNDYAEIPHVNGYLLDAGTATLWANVDVLGSVQGLWSKDSSGFDTGGHLTIRVLSSGQVNVRLQSTTTSYNVTSTTTVTAGIWFHVGFSWGPGGMVLTVDGTEQITNPYTGGLGTTSGGIGSYEPIAIAVNSWGSGNLVVTPLTQYFDGTLDDVRIFDYELTLSEVQTVMTCAGFGTTQFLIGHDGAGIHCLVEPVSVTAVDAGNNPVTGYAAEVTLDTQTLKGSWSLVTGNGVLTDTTPDDGLATYLFAVLDAGVAVFGLDYSEGPSPFDLEVFQTSDSTIRDDDSEGSLEFAPSGFTVTNAVLSNPPPNPINDPILTQIAGNNFPLHLTAYGQTDDDPICGVIESYNASRSLKFWFGYVDPVTGTRAPTVDGTSITTSQASATAQNVTFASGQASITLKYKDAGAISIGVADEASFTNTVSGGSNDFVVKPANLFVSRIESSGGSPNPEATTSTGPAFVTAGAPFVVDVDALDAEGDLTPNFGNEMSPESVRVISDSLVLPVGGRNGSTGDVAGGSNFAASATPGRFSNTAISFDEVGVIQLRPEVQDGDYLGVGGVIPVVTGNVGRFFPTSYNLINDLVNPACNGFTYIGEPALRIDFTIEARSVAGNVTENYDTALLGLPAVASVSHVAENADGGVDLSTRLSGLSSSWASGVWQVATLSANFARTPVPDGPFDALQIGVTVDDTLDGVALAALDMLATASGDCVVASNCAERALDIPTRLRYGRMSVKPNYGPETLDLDIPLEAQYYDGSAFRLNTDDACSTYALAAASLDVYTGNLDLGETSVIAPGVVTALISGKHDPSGPLLLQQPGLTNDGTVDIELDVPAWLEFDWLGSGDDDPRAKATFGHYRGHDRIIYWHTGGN